MTVWVLCQSSIFHYNNIVFIYQYILFYTLQSLIINYGSIGFIEPSTTDSRYIVVIYNTIMHTAQKLQCQNLGQTLHLRMTPHTSPLWSSYGVSFMSYSKKNDGNIYREHNVLSSVTLVL